MQLIIATPHGEKQYVINHISVETSAGALVVQEGHAPLITKLLPHTALDIMLKTGEQISVQLIRAGFLEINRTRTLVILNQPDAL